MTEKQKEIAKQKREFIINRAGGFCEHLDENGERDCDEYGSEIAHQISKSKMNLRMYGFDIVHHPKVMKWSCKGHNDSFNRGFRPRWIAEKVQEIEEEGIENWS